MKSKVLILFFCLFPLVVHSQKVSVSSLTESKDFIPGDDQRRDFNGDLCALIKLQVVDEVTDVEGNVMGDILTKGVEKWVYMAKGSKKIKIHLKNYLPVDIDFSQYNIHSLQGNRIYVLVLSQKPEEDKSKLDKIDMKDMSYIVCKVVGVKAGFISLKQDGIDGVLKIPVKEVIRIRYANGKTRKF